MPPDNDIRTQVEVARKQTPRTRKGRLEALPPHLRLHLIRELAAGTTLTALAETYDVSVPSIFEYRNRHQHEIDRQKQNIEDEFAALWIAQKANRIAAYEGEYERLDRHENADHHLWSLARQSALKNAAEELGQLPPRQSITVNAVTHVIHGVDIEEELR